MKRQKWTEMSVAHRRRPQVAPLDIFEPPPNSEGGAVDTDLWFEAIVRLLRRQKITEKRLGRERGIR